MARISTHVLDIAKGRPAAGIAVELRFGDAVIASAVTNSDGRTDPPLVSEALLKTGTYELIFHAASYLEAPRFFGDITIRFEVTETGGNYHVPLLLAAHGYSTYRGS